VQTVSCTSRLIQNPTLQTRLACSDSTRGSSKVSQETRDFSYSSRQSVYSFIWPLTQGSVPDEMNTSYGPRIDSDRWDFHDGIDLPAAVGTPVYAMADGVVHRAGPADKTAPGQGFGSTHILLQVVDPKDGKNDLFLVYLHLDSIAEGVIEGAHVNQGDVIGAVGREDATYPHLHFEFRKGGAQEHRSVHPLNYLPYTSTANFTRLRLDRSNFYVDDGEKRAIRICFEAPDRREGDLRGVDVELGGSGVEAQEFHVDFDNRETINSDQGDSEAFKNRIAVEGYQKSNLKDEGLSDLHYGVIVNDIAPEYEAAGVRVFDVKNGAPESARFLLPKLEAGENPVNSRVSFERQTFPPPGWELNLLSGNVCQPDETAALTDLRGLLCKDLLSLPGTLIRAGLRFALPAQRMSWRLRADIRPAELEMNRGQVIHPLAFLSGDSLVAAACLRQIRDDKYFAGVLIRSADGLFKERIDITEGEISRDVPVRWELELLRLGTRQTTAVVRVGNQVVARISGDTTKVEPDNACVGILHRHSGLQITLHVDQLVLTEKPRF
jgi:Peptidase family M23